MTITHFMLCITKLDELKMKVITPESLAKEVAKHWNFRYSNGSYGQDKVEKGIKLSALESPTPEDINLIIGNSSWTETWCHECGAKNFPVVEIGQTEDCDSYTAHICLSCLNDARELLIAEQNKAP